MTFSCTRWASCRVRRAVTDLAGRIKQKRRAPGGFWRFYRDCQGVTQLGKVAKGSESSTHSILSRHGAPLRDSVSRFCNRESALFVGCVGVHGSLMIARLSSAVRDLRCCFFSTADRACLDSYSSGIYERKLKGAEGHPSNRSGSPMKTSINCYGNEMISIRYHRYLKALAFVVLPCVTAASRRFTGLSRSVSCASCRSARS
ncbi:hypothetical protein BJ170DRAFT_377466 [Xylariales sp. AK1849]|nr:hypothetical protein BJ170DRAFT_377466 [Xylariales sp. AK1849]